METGFEKDWHILCCADKTGACEWCNPGVGAYVQTGLEEDWITGKSTFLKEIWIRMCPPGLDPIMEDSVVGLNIFHELMHMTSIVKDQKYMKR